MLFDAQIMAQNRNSRWRLSAILDFPNFNFWPMGLLRLMILSGYQIWCKNVDRRPNYGPNQNSRWRPSAILEFLYHHIGPPTKSFRWATLARQILSAIPTYIFEDIRIWIFCRIGLKCLFAPLKFRFLGSWPLKIIDHRRDPQKAHLYMKPRIMSVNAFNSVHICDLQARWKNLFVCLSVCVCVCVCVCL